VYAEKKLLQKRQKEYRSGNLRTIALDVTSRCNLKCPHCYAETFSNVEPVDLSLLQKVFDEAYDLGVLHYVLQGGEPIIDKERLEQIIKMMHPDETYINVVSNGWGMSRECIRWLKSLKVDKIALSLDSGIETEHDSNRGNGSWRKVLQAIDDVLSEDLLTSISTVITRQSIHSEGFTKALELARSKKIRIDVQIAMPVGKWDGKKEYLITQKDASYVKRLQHEYPLLPNGQRMINRDIFNYGGLDHCPAGSEFVSITANGNFLPCNFCQISLGNIKDSSLADMRNYLLEFEWFRGKHPVCLIGEDEQFIDRFIMPYVNNAKPLDAYEIFNKGGI
jgi:MoaA/NifB/PqqE/SkfB family radical SAM enzyme